MKVYIIQDEEGSVLGTTSSKERAKEIFRDNIDYDMMYEYVEMDNEDADADEIAALTEKEIDTIAEHLVNDEDPGIDFAELLIWIEVHDLTE